jgi:hypothetical protein
VAEGAWGTVECIVTSPGVAPAERFLEELELVREGPKSKPESTAKAKFLVLFDQMAQYGRVSPKRFGREMGGLWAFKHEVCNIQIRFPCFQDGRRWLLTHGFKKPGAKKGLGKWPRSEIERATQIIAEYKTRPPSR